MKEQKPNTIKQLTTILDSGFSTYLVLGVGNNDEILIGVNGKRRDLTLSLWRLLKQDPSFADIFVDALILARGSDVLYRDSGEVDDYVREVIF